MTEPKYVIVGRGRWAGRMHCILSGAGRKVASLGQSRPASSETESGYRQRFSDSFKSTGAQIAWLCVPPGRHVAVLTESALEAGLHVVVEKPWFCSPEETGLLEALAKARHAIVAIHYEYCLMTQVETWHREWSGGKSLQFRGHMKVNRPDHIGLPALENLGSHLFSIQEFAVPESTVAEIDCGYEQPGRTARLAGKTKQAGS